MSKSNDIINWGQLSRLLSGSRQTVRKNKVPIKHQPIVNELINAIDAVLSKLPDRAKKREEQLNNKELLSDDLSKK